MNLKEMYVFSWYSDVLHQWNWPPRYSWTIVESGVKHNKHNLNHYSDTEF